MPSLKPLKFFLNLDPNVPYLRDRGISDAIIRKFGIGLCNRGVLKGYVAMPVHNWPRSENQLPVAYFGRWPGVDFDECAGRPRYKWPVEFPKQQIIYGIHEAISETAVQSPIVVTEGTFGVFHLAQNGFPGVVAIFGSSLSDRQSDLLISTGRPIILMFDGDEAGRQGMRVAAAKLMRKAFVRVAWLKDGVQPDQLEKVEIVRLLG